MYRRNYLLASPGHCYLIYSRDGGTLDIKTPPGEYEIESVLLNERRPRTPSLSPAAGCLRKTGKLPSSCPRAWTGR